jgi:hypothetical protein
MNGRILITIVIASSIFLAPILSIAQDDYSNVIAPNTTIDNLAGNSVDMQGHSSDAQDCHAYLDGRCSNIKGKFYEGISYTGKCDWLPKGSICLTYSDNYKWVVSDYRIDCVPHIVGNSNSIPIELIRCYYADYYHILGTSLVMSIPKPEEIFIRSVPLTYMPTQDDSP